MFTHTHTPQNGYGMVWVKFWPEIIPMGQLWPLWFLRDAEVLSGTFMEKDHPDPIPYARRTQARGRLGASIHLLDASWKV
jgi:hypothetical protein